ncbi:NAD(P)/FAD-dependent oxidoreductase [Granulosicoccus sp. 3-233]|uniref:NAD(P)/FAD-dependent oxidoreductase n=1 Tax=Granulosicoccus sp. 3-233 TaxID=3417969 RepID=UPI003D3265B1
MHYVIIGAGPAGVNAAEHLRQYDPLGKITLLVAEDVPPYSRMALPYYLADNIPPEGTYLRKQAGHFEALNIDLLQGRASSIDTSAKRITLSGGDKLDYDKLLIATGATATRPPIPGIDLDHVHNCWTLKDAHKIVAGTERGSRVILMGAGFIGCIILEALAERGVELTVIEMQDRMVARMTNQAMGNMIKDWCVGKGIGVKTSTGVTSIEQGSDSPLMVHTDQGESLPTDVVICATGVRSNTVFLDGSGIEIDLGIVVDDYLQTSVPDVYAAGDVAQGRDLSTGEYHVQAIQPTAVEHGRLAAHNMVYGHGTPHPGNVNMNILDTAGLISTSFGLWMGVEGGDEAEMSDSENFKYLNLQFRDDVLVGASSLGMTQHVGVMRGLIQTGSHLGEWKDKLMREPNRLSEAYLACAQSQHKALGPV